jgi:carbon-monoxide dehydrogenase large subunit
MSIMGTRVVRTEDPVFLSRGATYTDDLTDERLNGALHLTLVRSPLAHGRITGIDVEAAKAAPGVIGVFTAADLDLSPALLFPAANRAMVRPFLATDRVRFVGEPVAAVLTEHPYQGPDAAELVEVDYDPLPAVIGLKDSLAGEVVLFDEAGTNLALAFDDQQFDDHLFDDCEVVVSASPRPRWRRAPPRRSGVRTGGSRCSPRRRTRRWRVTRWRAGSASSRPRST